jgi:thiol-disulfide isomerase/thioredoxin
LFKLTASTVSGIVLFAILMMFLGCGQKQSISGQIPTIAFKTYAGDSFTLSAEDKTVTLLVFWATWCQPCLMEIPSLVRLHDQFKGRNFRVLAVNVDDPEGQKVRAISREYGITYPVLVGNDEIMKQFGGITGLPTSFIIGKDGRIREKLQGLRPEQELEHKVQLALGE